MKPFSLITLITFLHLNSFSQNNIKAGHIAPPITITDWIANTPKDKELKNTLLSGTLIMGHEGKTFKPCGGDKVFWVTDRTGKLNKLYEELTKGNKPYTPIFAEIEIIDKGRATEGFPADYESVYEVYKVIKTSKTTNKDCP